MREYSYNVRISTNLRFALAGVLSLLLILADNHFSFFKDLRYYVESYLTPVYYIADGPISLITSNSERFLSYHDIVEENRLLRQQLSEIRIEMLRYDSVVRDNEELRRLNNSPIKESFQKMGAEVMMVDTNPFSLTVMINRGAKDGVYEGQAVINEQGVVGQVISVAKSTSRVLLISDQNHSIPVVVMRNGIRAIATGTGIINELNIVNMPRNVDIQVGDLLATSGLGGGFPAGYPVARVTAFDRKDGFQFAEIKAQPLATLDRLRYMLLLWLPDSDQETIEEITSNKEIDNNVRGIKDKTPQKSIPTMSDKKPEDKKLQNTNQEDVGSRQEDKPKNSTSGDGNDN
jgi:rod shape-determining protein MreC